MNFEGNLKKSGSYVELNVALKLKKITRALYWRKEKYKKICSSLKRKSFEREKSNKCKINELSTKLKLEKKKNEELANEILEYKSILWKVSTGSMERKNKLLEFENSELKRINDERCRKLEHLENNIKKEMKKNKKARETMLYLTSRRGYHDKPASPSSPSSSFDYYYTRKRNKRIASGSPVKKFEYFSPRIMRKTRSVDNYSESKWKEQGWGVMKKDERQRKKLDYNIDVSMVKKKKSSSFRKNARIELRESHQFSRSNSRRSGSRSPNSTKIGNKIRKANIKKDVSETVDIEEEEEIEGEEAGEIMVVKKVKEEKEEDLLEEIQLQSEIEKEIINIEKTIDLPAEADPSKTIEEVEEAYESEENEKESCKEEVVVEERKNLEKHEKDNEDSIFQEDNIHYKVSEEQKDENNDAFAEIVDDSVSEDGSTSSGEKKDFVDIEKLIKIGEESEGEEDVFEKFIEESEVRQGKVVKEGMEEEAKENENFEEINSLYSSSDNSEEEEFTDNFGINLEDIEKELKEESENEKFYYGSENSGSFQDLDELLIVDVVKSEEKEELGEEEDDKEDKDEEEKITFHKAVSEGFEDDILVLEGNDDVEENEEKSSNNSDSNSKEEEFDFMKDTDDGNSDIIMLNSVGDGETSEFKFSDDFDSLVI